MRAADPTACLAFLQSHHGGIMINRAQPQHIQPQSGCPPSWCTLPLSFLLDSVLPPWGRPPRQVVAPRLPALLLSSPLLPLLHPRVMPSCASSGTGDFFIVLVAVFPSGRFEQSSCWVCAAAAAAASLLGAECVGCSVVCHSGAVPPPRIHLPVLLLFPFSGGSLWWSVWCECSRKMHLHVW